MRVEYVSNNSGGSWWLSDQNWKDLEAAGWVVEWIEERWLGALAKRACREGMHLREAVEEWENVTGMSSTDAGCPCCGQPHSFTEYDDNDKYVDSGPSTSYGCEW